MKQVMVGRKTDDAPKGQKGSLKDLPTSQPLNANAQAAIDATIQNARYENMHADMQYEAIRKANKGDL